MQAAQFDQSTRDQHKALKKTPDQTDASLGEFLSKRNAEKELMMETRNHEYKAQAEAACKKDIQKEHKAKRANRMPSVLVPMSGKIIPYLEDKDGNCVYTFVAYKPQIEDVIKALRKKQITARKFSYDREAWQRETAERQELQESLDTKTKQLNEIAQSVFQTNFVSLMHLKVIRAYIDGVLRFGIPPRFFLGVVMPKRGDENSILQEMTKVLAEDNMKDFYGEKIDASETDDFWPFVCIKLTSPSFLFSDKH